MIVVSKILQAYWGTPSKCRVCGHPFQGATGMPHAEVRPEGRRSGVCYFCSRSGATPRPERAPEPTPYKNPMVQN